jgi:hypothetical protein
MSLKISGVEWFILQMSNGGGTLSLLKIDGLQHSHVVTTSTYFEVFSTSRSLLLWFTYKDLVNLPIHDFNLAYEAAVKDISEY